ncbi:hypothetical protein MHY1_00689 [Methylovirgula sp. HY1]|nr:hypothetical protein MHY1_00689 [Methylovirgula sp. HY1]
MIREHRVVHRSFLTILENYIDDSLLDMQFDLGADLDSGAATYGTIRTKSIVPRQNHLVVSYDDGPQTRNWARKYSAYLNSDWVQNSYVEQLGSLAIMHNQGAQIAAAFNDQFMISDDRVAIVTQATDQFSLSRIKICADGRSILGMVDLKAHASTELQCAVCRPAGRNKGAVTQKHNRGVFWSSVRRDTITLILRRWFVCRLKPADKWGHRDRANKPKNGRACYCNQRAYEQPFCKRPF